MKRKKPEPHSWHVNEFGIVPKFDFTTLVRRDPPRFEDDCKVLKYPMGTMKNGCWISF